MEFVEVMRQLGRICASNFGECDICDLHSFCPSKTFLDKYAKSGRAERLEKMVMSWAAENPEPQYPTWGEYLTQIGAVNLVEQTQTYVHTALFFKPIPADMAQKLGIEPKEV